MSAKDNVDYESLYLVPRDVYRDLMSQGHPRHRRELSESNRGVAVKEPQHPRLSVDEELSLPPIEHAKKEGKEEGRGEPVGPAEPRDNEAPEGKPPAPAEAAAPVTVADEAQKPVSGQDEGELSLSTAPPVKVEKEKDPFVCCAHGPRKSQVKNATPVPDSWRRPRKQPAPKKKSSAAKSAPLTNDEEEPPVKTTNAGSNSEGAQEMEVKVARAHIKDEDEVDGIVPLAELGMQ